MLALNPTMYRGISTAFVPETYIRSEIARLVARIVGFDDFPAWSSFIRRFSEQPLNAVLGCKLKTHTPAGEVLPRAIHKMRGSIFYGLSQWLAFVIIPHLAQLPHIAKDSFAMKAMLESTLGPQPEIVKLWVVGLKDFCLSGSALELATSLKTGTPGSAELKTLLFDVAFHVLDTSLSRPQVAPIGFAACEVVG